MKLLLLFMALQVFAFSASASETELLVSIDKQGVSPEEVTEAVEALNFQDPTMGRCYVESRVLEYIPYTSAPYHGVAIVRFNWKCDDYAQKFLTIWETSPMYSVWSNPKIGPKPGVSGSN